MGRSSDKILTEGYRDKRYEEDLTKLYFEVIRDIRMAETCPSIEYLKMALATANCFIGAVIYSKHHLPDYRDKIAAVLNEIKIILHGDPRLPSVVKISTKYNARTVKIRNKWELHNGMALLDQINNAVFLVKQWAYEEGLFLSKPIDRKFGREAIEEVMQQ